MLPHFVIRLAIDSVKPWGLQLEVWTFGFLVDCKVVDTIIGSIFDLETF